MGDLTFSIGRIGISNRMRLLLVSQLDFFWQTERQRTRSSQFLLKLKEIRCLLLHKGSSGVGMLHEKMDDREDSSTPSTTTLKFFQNPPICNHLTWPPLRVNLLIMNSCPTAAPMRSAIPIAKFPKT